MWTISKNKTWADIAHFDWVQDMHHVPQSPIHHAEGDVATHTRMVLDALCQQPEYQQLDTEAQEILWAAALMHDIEKRSTTFTDAEGHIVSPGHARKGALTTHAILYRQLAAPFGMRQHISALVRHHGLPLWIFSRANLVQTLLQASLCLNTQWLYLLAKADALGRICSDQNDLLYRLELFRELCIEHHCWGTPYPFPNDATRFRFFHKPDQQPDTTIWDDSHTPVTILCGIAGSGKDHYISTKHKGATVISLDDKRRKARIDRNDTRGQGRIIQEALAEARGYLRAGQPFIWNATNITRQMREHLAGIFLPYKPLISMVYVEVPYKTLVAQNENRQHALPLAAINRMVDRLEVPQLWEAHQVHYAIRQ